MVDLACEGERRPRFGFRRFIGLARIAKLPGVFGQDRGSAHEICQRRIKCDALLSYFDPRVSATRTASRCIE